MLISTLPALLLALTQPQAELNDARNESAPVNQVFMNDHGTPDPPAPVDFEAGDFQAPILPNSHLLDGAPVSFGPKYKATYEDGGMTFTPALGKRAPHTRHLRFDFEGATIGSIEVPANTAGVQARMGDGQVELDRGGLVEVYEAREAGLKQSFVFDELPSRAGDLVVRGRLTTDLQRLSGEESERLLVFEEPGFARITVDGVLGFDAAGREVEGELRLTGTELELRLHRSFVELAELPLVLDPVVGVEDDPFSSNPADRDQVAVAAERETNTQFSDFALAFTRYYSATDPDLFVTRGQYNDGSSTPGDPTYLITYSAEINPFSWDQEPAIAWANINSGWVITLAWQRATSPTSGDEQILIRTINSNGGVEDIDEAGPGTDPDVAATGSHSVVVYDAGGAIRAQGVDTFVSFKQQLGLNALTYGSSSVNAAYNHPSISPHPTTTNTAVFVVVSERDYTEDSDLHITLVDRFGATVSGTTTLTTIGPDEEYPDVSVDGTQGVLVFQREQVKNDGDNDVIAREFTVNPIPFGFDFSLDPSEVVVEGGFNDDERYPAVASSRTEWIVTWMDETGFLSYGPYVRTLAKLDCQPCEPRQAVGTAAFLQGELEVASTQYVPSVQGIDRPDVAHIAWERFGSPDEVVVRSWISDDADQTVSVLGTPCTPGANIGWWGGASIGSSSFNVTLDMDPTFNGVAVLNLAAPGLPIPCGSCDVAPIGTLYAPEAVVNGKATFSTPIPCMESLLDGTATVQWIIVDAGSSCLEAGTLGFSQRLEVTFGL